MSMAWDLSNNIWAIKEEGKTKPSNGTSEERKKAATNNGSNSKSQRNTPIFTTAQPKGFPGSTKGWY